MPTQEKSTYKGFLISLLNQETLLSSADSNYWRSIAIFVCQIYTFYSVKSKSSWLSREIQKCYPKEEMEKLEHTDTIVRISADLQRIYQNIEALLSNAHIPEDLRNDPEIKLLLQHNEEHDFSGYLVELVKQAQETINSIKDTLNHRLAKLQKQSAMALQERLEGLLSSANDLIIEHEENIKKLCEENLGLYNEILEKKDAVDKDVKTVEDLIKKTRDDANNVLSTVLTVLGIFVAIVIAFIGGYFSISASLESKISNIPQIQLAHFMLMGHVVINLIFMFMFMLARLSNKNLCVMCTNCTGHSDSSKCHTCGCQCNWHHRLTRKYPYIVMTNWFFIVGYVVLFLWWYVDEFLYDTIYTILSNSVVGKIVCLFVLILLLAIVVFTPPFLIWYKRKKQDSTATTDTASPHLDNGQVSEAE